MQPKFCAACGTALLPGAAFCTACGAPVQVAPDTPPAPPAHVVASPPPTPPAAAPVPPVAPHRAAAPSPAAPPQPAAPQAAPLPASGADWNSPELQPGETELDTWTVDHPAPSGSLVNGKLTVTNHRVLFKPLVSGVSVYKIVRSQSAHFKNAHTLILRKDEIASVQVQKSFLKKKVLVTATNGTTYIFDRGAMSVDPIVAAIQQRWSAA